MEWNKHCYGTHVLIYYRWVVVIVICFHVNICCCEIWELLKCIRHLANCGEQAANLLIYIRTHVHAYKNMLYMYIHMYINTHVHVLHMYISYATTSRHTAAHLAYFLPSAITFFILHPTVLPLPPSLILSLILPLCQALQIIIPSDNVTLTATQQARDADSSRLPQLPHIQIQIQI